MVDPLSIKNQSETAILADGGKIYASLGTLDPSQLIVRDGKEIAQRALVLNVMINVSYGAPQHVAFDWLEANDLLDALSEFEATVLEAEETPDEDTKMQLRWGLESLWSLAWAGSLFNDLTPLQPVSNDLATRFPSLRTGEPAAGFYRRFSLRTKEELFRKLDLFYRSLWYARDFHLRGVDSTPFNPGILHYRWKALEWALHDGMEWDDIDLGT
jgi:hypothetical protein